MTAMAYTRRAWLAILGALGLGARPLRLQKAEPTPGKIGKSPQLLDPGVISARFVWELERALKDAGMRTAPLDRESDRPGYLTQIYAGVDLAVSDSCMLLTIDQFSERYLLPAANSMADHIARRSSAVGRRAGVRFATPEIPFLESNWDGLSNSDWAGLSNSPGSGVVVRTLRWCGISKSTIRFDCLALIPRTARSVADFRTPQLPA